MSRRSLNTERGHTLCASLRSRNAFQNFTRATLYRNLQEEGSHPEWAPWSSTGLSPTVRTLQCGHTVCWKNNQIISKGCRPCRRPRKNPQWIKPNWQKWRTEKHQNCAQTLPNVTSETYRKFAILATFSSCFLLLLLLLLLLLFKKTSSKRSCLKSNNSQRQIPMAVKDGKASKLRPKTP